MAIRWYQEDGEWFGWTSDLDMREDEPRFVVRSPEEGVWAAWEYCGEARDMQCITLDFSHHHDAKGAVQDIVDHEDRRNALWRRSRALFNGES